MRISDWSSDVCSSDLARNRDAADRALLCPLQGSGARQVGEDPGMGRRRRGAGDRGPVDRAGERQESSLNGREQRGLSAPRSRSEEHTSELQSLMRISYAVFCLKKKTKQQQQHNKQLST